METNTDTCKCKEAELVPAEHFWARGKMHVILALNLKGFIAQESQKEFERLRGGTAFATAIKQLKPSSPFYEDVEEEKTIKRGRELSVFRGHLVSDWLFPTFRLDKSETRLPDANSVSDEWKQFEFHIRFHRTGFLEIKLTRQILTDVPDNSQRLIDVLRDISEISSRGSSVQPIQWTLALGVANEFVKALPPKITVIEQGKEKEIALQPQVGEKPLPERQRYTALMLDTILCKGCDKRIDAAKFFQRDKKILGAVLEGALIHMRDGQLAFPEFDVHAVKRFEDLASWKSELCIFAPERCLIYYPPTYIFLPGQDTAHEPVPYEEYWKCILRGIEHTLAVRAALQIIESHTTRDLDKVPLLTAKVTDGDISKKDEEEINLMAQEVSNTFNILPGLRDVLTPTSAFRASYAVTKFAKLNETLRLQDTMQHIQRNVDELVIFLNHFTNVRLQEELQRDEASLNKIGVLIAATSLAVTAPSFLLDLSNFIGTGDFSAKIIAVVILGLVYSFIGLLLLRFMNRAYKGKIKERFDKRFGWLSRFDGIFFGQDRNRTEAK